MQHDEILEDVLEEFNNFARIPRQSGHEQGISDFLKSYLQALGLTVVQDGVNNIIADLPATAGLEKAPRIILQGHMDMVCVAEDGVEYDPLQDAIRLNRTDKYLEAVGTSLGADDGMGLAVALYVLKHCQQHGPLRFIATVDEERGMTGAINLSAKYLTDASYLINCDSENYDELTVGSAGSVNLDFTKEIARLAPKGQQAWQISISGLQGGHSGEQIGSGRGNAIRTLALALTALDGKDDAIELASMDGGKARNAIPDTAAAVIVTDKDENAIQAILSEQKAHFLAVYGYKDPGMVFTLQKAEQPEKVFAAGDKKSLLRLLDILHTGVYAMSQAVPGLVETSANLGVIRTDAKGVEVQFFPRSGIDEQVDEFVGLAENVAALTGFTAQVGTKSPGWKENKDSRLAGIMAEVFEAQNGRPMKVEIIHAGLECGWHFLKNPKLDMVSIGVTTQDIHSPQEKLVLSTVRPQAELVMATIAKLAKL